jgi:hypothetical protein
MNPIYQSSLEQPVQVIDMALHPWQPTANPGLLLKPVRHQDLSGEFLGLVKFDAMARSGLHQHQGVATSFVIEGGLTDYHGSINLHEAGINQKGSTHDAIAYCATTLVSRLEGPVTYPINAHVSGVHAGSRQDNFVNPNPLIPPEINRAVDFLPEEATGYFGASRQIIFDYEGTGTIGRYCQFTLLPEAAFEFNVTGLTEFWVRGGNLRVNGIDAHANCFIICEPASVVTIEAPFGALLLGWADRREIGQRESDNLFGF